MVVAAAIEVDVMVDVVVAEDVVVLPMLAIVQLAV
jgi:hypothetical protein